MSSKSIFAAALLLQLVLTGRAHGQIRSGTITGSVTDATSAVVPGAAVSIVNQETNITANMNASEAGQFVFPYLPAGHYTVTVTVPGFVIFKESGLKLETAQTVRVDATLKPSSVETTVEVQAQAAHIQTDSTSVSGALQTEAIDA